jgi:hypothetical protein
MVYALEHDKPLVRIDAEPFSLPPELLPLASARTAVWHATAPGVFEASLVLALAENGIDATAALTATGGTADEVLYHPGAALIRPSYTVLAQEGPDAWREHVRRLNQAAALNPQNPYNELSLAFLWIYQRDAARALNSARKALDGLQREPCAHYAEALALCLQSPPQNRTKEETEGILRRLAVARRLPAAGAHIDLLSALVIANYYAPKFLTPPAPPGQLLAQGLAAGRRFDPGENARTAAVEPVLRGALSESETALAALYLEPRREE